MRRSQASILIRVSAGCGECRAEGRPGGPGSVGSSDTISFNCVGVESISNKLKTNLESGLLGGDFPARKEFFGDNFRPPLKAKTFCKIFFEALDDFMLKVLLVAATGSLIFEYIGADPDHYSTGK